jgi:small subunit ribosomal protein S19
MTRSIWKGPFVHPSLLKKIDKLKNQPSKKPIKTWSRNSTIIPDFVGHSLMIHNGRSFKGHTPADKKAAAEKAAAAPSGGTDAKK